MSVELSIIIPVYNVKNYLTCCIESVLAQGCNSYEMILVDDGSTDGGAAICDELSREYPTISVVHQENQGLSAARNAGLDIAKGEYITFVDSDDTLMPNTLMLNMRQLHKHPEIDLLEYPVEVHAGSEQSHMLSFPDELQTDDIFNDWIRREGYMHCYAWNKIYRAALWQDIRFPVGEAYEDTAVMPHIIRRCQCIYYSSMGCYRYVMHPMTITTHYRYTKHRQLLINNVHLLQEIAHENAIHEEACRLWICCMNILVDMGRCTDVDRHDYRKQTKTVRNCKPPYRQLIKAAEGWHTKCKLRISRLTGLRIYTLLYRLIAKKL